MRVAVSEGMAIVPGYRTVHFLGKGGFGEVWKAIGPGKVPLALKIIELKGSKAGQREFRSLDLLRELRHPNLLPLQGYWLLDETGTVLEDEQGDAATLVIAMLLGERSLRQRLEECQKSGSAGIPINELMEYMRDAAKGIDFLNSPRHDFGEGLVSIQHRDIKPENLLIVGGGVMLADFGISRMLGSDSNIVMTETAAMTIWYAAPELFDFKASIWTDQYALAITYFELRTGRLPFRDGATPTSVMATHLRGGHDLTSLGPAEQAVLRRATAVVPQERFPTCIELVAELATALQDEPRFANLTTEARSANLATPIGGTPSGAAKQLDILVRTTSRSSKNLSAAPSPDATRVTEALGKDATQPERPGEKTCLFGDEQSTTQSAEAVAPAAADLVARRSRAVLAAAAIVLALPLGWWTVTRLFRENAPQSKPGVANGGLESEPIPDVGDEVGSTTTSAASAQAARDAAAVALARGEFPRVISSLDPIIRDGHATPDDFRTRARAWLRLADLDDDPKANLRNAADDFAAADENDDRIDTLTRLGLWLHRHDRPREAVKTLQECIELKRSPDVFIALAEAQMAAGQPDAARESADAALELASDSDEREAKRMAAQAHRALAHVLIQLGETFAKLEPPMPDAVEDNDQKAEEHLLAAVAAAEKLELNEVEAWQNELSKFRAIPRVAARAKARRLQMMIADLRRESDESPDDAAVLLKLAEAEVEAGQKDEAARHFVVGHSRQAIKLLIGGKLAEAEAALGRAAEKANGAEHAILQFARGLISVQKGNDDTAVRAFASAIDATTADDGDRWRYFAARAAAVARRAARPDGKLDDWERAARDAATAIESGPKLSAPAAGESPTSEHREFATLHHVRAGALESLAGNERTPAAAKALEDAEQAALMAVAFDSQDIRYSLTAARVLLRRARIIRPAQSAAIQQQAEGLIAAAIKLHENSAEAHNLQGELLLLQGKVAAAQSAFEKAADLAEQAKNEQTSFTYALNLSYAYLRAPADNAKALAAADRAVAATPRDPAGHFARGLALRNLKRASESLAAFDDALAAQPIHVGSLLAKSQLVLEMENATNAQIAQANRDIDTAFAESSDDLKPEAYYVRSLARLKTHVTNATQPAVAEPALVEAERDLVQAIKLMPTNAVYTNAATELFGYAARFNWKDSKRKAESQALQQDLKAAREQPSVNEGD